MITLPATHTLEPRLLDGIYCFPSTTTDLVKLDLLFEAGAAYQPQRLCAAAANKLFPLASVSKDATYVAEFMDYRGIVVETSVEIQQSTLTLYFLRRYADELLPLVGELLRQPAFPQDEFLLWREKKRQEIATRLQSTSYVARMDFYQSLFGTSHPLGTYAVADDADKLQLDSVKQFYRQRYNKGANTIVLSGNVDAELVSLVNQHIARPEHPSPAGEELPMPQHRDKGGIHKVRVNEAVQTTIRMGRLLPLRWDDPAYTDFMLLTTLLGGHFGSRLMSNLREDKGYTYGISARSQIYRGLIVFYITGDVAAETADAACNEIFAELRRLDDISDEELGIVKNVLAGDFVRSIDGVFERAERFCNMSATHVTEQLTANLSRSLENTTAAQLQELARRLLNPESMTVCLAGNY